MVITSNYKMYKSRAGSATEQKAYQEYRHTEIENSGVGLSKRLVRELDNKRMQLNRTHLITIDVLL
jgi:hypothetical protein